MKSSNKTNNSASSVSLNNLQSNHDNPTHLNNLDFIDNKNHYLFFCCNVRTDGRKFCGGPKTEELLEYCRSKIKAIKEQRPVSETGILKANKTGCLGRCSLGPNVAVFPNDVWYRCETTEDVDAILEDCIQ